MSIDNLRPATLALTSAVCLGFVLLGWGLRSWLRLRHVPGPFRHSVSSLPLVKLARSGRMSYVLDEMQSKYGMRRLVTDLVLCDIRAS